MNEEQARQWWVEDSLGNWARPMARSADEAQEVAIWMWEEAGRVFGEIVRIKLVEMRS